MWLTIKAFFDSLTQVMKTYETSIENKTTNEVVKEKNALKRASDITEQILIIVDKYEKFFDEKDAERYNKLKKKFLKVN